MPEERASPWSEVVPDDLDALRQLALRRLAVDGGLPLSAEPGFLRSRWLGDGIRTRALRDSDGRVVAASALRPGGDGTVRLTVLVDPEIRDDDIAAELLDAGLRSASSSGSHVTVETESLGVEQAALFASRGLRQVFAEDVLRIDLASPPESPAWPDGARLHTWSSSTAPRFFAVYEASFRDRAGFPGDSAETWIGDLEDDDGFRPGWSVLVDLPGVGDAGFVTAAVGWVDQVGVIPQARGRGLGAALTAAALSRMRADGETEAWLNVNVDNPAKSVYLRLGFTQAGRRARFEAP